MTTNNQSGGDGFLPCPFCGHVALRSDFEGSFEDPNYGGSIIECQGCLASTRVFFGEKVGLDDAWNTRRPAKPMDAQDVGDDEISDAIGRVNHLMENFDLFDEYFSALKTLIRAAQSKPSATKVMTIDELHDMYDYYELENAQKFLECLSKDFPQGIRIVSTKEQANVIQVREEK